MTHFQELSTAKYYDETVRQQNEEVRRQKNRDAIRAFGQFLFAFGVFAATWYAIQQMPNWLPTVTAYMDQSGITDTLQNARNWLVSIM